MRNGIKNVHKIMDKYKEVKNNTDNCYGKAEPETSDGTNENRGLIESECIMMADTSAENEDEILSKFSNVFHQFKDFTAHYHKLQAIWFFRFFVKCSIISLLLLLGFYHYESGYFDSNTYIVLHLLVLFVCIWNSAWQLLQDRRLGTSFQEISDEFEDTIQVLSKWCDENNPNFAKIFKLLIKGLNVNSNIDIKSNGLISLILFEVILWFTNTICFVINVFQQRQLHTSTFIFCIITLVTAAMEILLNVIISKSFKINETMNDDIKNMRNIIDECNEVEHNADNCYGEIKPENADSTNEDSGFIELSSSSHDFQVQNKENFEKDHDSKLPENENLSMPKDDIKNSRISTDTSDELIDSECEICDNQQNEIAIKEVEDSITLDSSHGYDKHGDSSIIQELLDKKSEKDPDLQSIENENMFTLEDDGKSSTTSSAILTEYIVSEVEACDIQQNESVKIKVEDFSTLENFYGYDMHDDPHTIQEQQDKKAEKDPDLQSIESENMFTLENDDKSFTTSSAVLTEYIVSEVEECDIQENESVKIKVEDFSTLESSHEYDRHDDPHTIQEQQDKKAEKDPDLESIENDNMFMPEDDGKSSPTSSTVLTGKVVSDVEACDIQEKESVKIKVEDFTTLDSSHGYDRQGDAYIIQEQQGKKTEEGHGLQSSENLSMPKDDKKHSIISSTAEKISKKHDNTNTSTGSVDCELLGPFNQGKHVGNKPLDFDTTDESEDEPTYILKVRSCPHSNQRKDTDHKKIAKQVSERKVGITYGKLKFHMDLSPESEVELKFKLSGKSMKMKTSTVAADATPKLAKKD